MAGTRCHPPFFTSQVWLELAQTLAEGLEEATVAAFSQVRGILSSFVATVVVCRDGGGCPGWWGVIGSSQDGFASGERIDGCGWSRGWDLRTDL